MSIDLMYAKVTKSTDSTSLVAEFVLLLSTFLHSITRSKTVVSKREIVYFIKEREMIKETRYNFIH